MTAPAEDTNGFGVELFEEDCPGGPPPGARLWAKGNPGSVERDVSERAGELPVEPNLDGNGFTIFPRETLRAWLAEDGKPAEPNLGPLQLARRLFNSRRLGDALFGAVLGGLAFFVLWFTGFEPPAGLRPRAWPSQDPPLQTAPLVPEQRPETADASEKLALLVELDVARQDARQAVQVAEEAVAQIADRDERLKASEDKLEAMEIRLREVASQQKAVRQTQRTALAPPDSLPLADPARAYQSYVKGLDSYTAGRHTDAEREFQAAVDADDQDARYHYFLGLSRQALGKEAEGEFRRGSELERQQRPSRVFISVALESVPGEALQVLNRFRPPEDRPTLVP